ncbi:MAG: hypothetical protein KY443_06065 [Actinobacteria bacterium]|nr:hypothetical protein [Actinomycetota bacterium]
MACATTSVSSEATEVRPAERVLQSAAAVYFVGFMFHNGDHMRRGIDVVTRHVFWGGIAVGLATAFALALVVMRHPMASRVAVAVGFSTALGVTAAHLLPEWSAFSDSLPDGNPDAMSWAAVLAEIGGAFTFGVAGLYAWRAEASAVDS